MKLNIRKDSKENFHIFSQKTGKCFVVDKTPFFYDEESIRLLDVSITNFCNRECGFCYKSSSIKGRHMELDDYKKVICEAVDCGVKQIAIGGGEPTTHPDFVEILRHTRNNDIVPNYSTNGDDISEEIIDATAQNCGAVAISVYEPIENYKEVANRFLDRNCRVNLHFIMRKSNLVYLTALIKQPPEWFSNLNALVFLNYKPAVQSLLEESINGSDGLAAFFGAVKGYKTCGVAFDTCSVSYICTHLEIEKELYDFCESARTSAYINENLDVYPCSFYKSGSISLRTKSLRKIWARGKAFIEHREKLLYKLGSDCKHKYDCAGGCPIYPINYCNDCYKNEDTE